MLNGEASDSGTRVEGATIVLNRTQILGPGSFDPDAHETVVAVELAQENTLAVELDGARGEFVTVRVKQTVDVSLNIVARIHFNINVSSFRKSRAFYDLLGFTESQGFPARNTLEVAQSLHIDHPQGYLLHGELVSVSTNPSAVIDLIEFKRPPNNDPPYPHVYHLGMARAALATTDLEGDVAFLESLEKTDVEFLSEPAVRADGTRFVFLQDLDGTFLELVEDEAPSGGPDPTRIHVIGVKHVNVNVADFERAPTLKPGGVGGRRLHPRRAGSSLEPEEETLVPRASRSG